MNRPQRPAGQTDGRRHDSKVVAHDDEVRSIDGHVSPRPDRKAEVGARQRRAVVDAIAHHGNRSALVLQAPDQGDFVRRQGARHHLAYSDRRADGTSRGFVVPGQEDAAQPESMLRVHSSRRRRSHRIGHRKCSDHSTVTRHKHGGPS